jgi:hypothetical protein
MDTPSATSQVAAAPLSARESPTRLRMWPVLLTLYFLSPLVGEVLSGSTPPLLFVQPFGFIFTPLLYGSSAILIREMVVRRRLGWGNVLILGAGFGIFQEALVVQTWFNFMAKSSPSHSNGSYAVLFGTNWDWAFNLTVYHAVISITVPLILLRLFFPRRAALPALRPLGAIVLLAWLLIPCGLLALNVATRQFASQGYQGPPLAGYLIALALLALTLTLGCLVRFREPRLNLVRSAPWPWLVGLAVFGLTTLYFAQSIFLPAARVPAPVSLLSSAGLVAFALWRVREWSRRRGWDARHALAIAMGVLAYFLVIWAPLIEFGLKLPLREGLALANALVFLGLLLFGWRLSFRLRRQQLNA